MKNNTGHNTGKRFNILREASFLGILWGGGIFISSLIGIGSTLLSIVARAGGEQLVMPTGEDIGPFIVNKAGYMLFFASLIGIIALGSYYLTFRGLRVFFSRPRRFLSERSAAFICTVIGVVVLSVICGFFSSGDLQIDIINLQTDDYAEVSIARIQLNIGIALLFFGGVLLFRRRKQRG